MFCVDNKGVRLNNKIVRIFKEEKIVINVSFFLYGINGHTYAACW